MILLQQTKLLALLVVLCAVTRIHAGCPFAASANSPPRAARLQTPRALNRPKPPPLADLRAVRNDIIDLINSNQTFWPADTFSNNQSSYGPFFIRQAWHCAGSYRIYDGRGGCDGGRQRFEPERSWPDNTNLDKAKRLMAPIKQKYGDSLSWGDLIIFAGTVAIEVMGGPKIGFCAGRIDDDDGSDSVLLGPTPEQAARFPCPQSGNCSSPLGSTTVGLIYVNPEGPQANGNPVGSGLEVRDTFSRMGHSDKAAVALIGGGHAFGKTHGACPDGPGPDPQHSPWNPWPGNCSNGVFTSGFEGPWTTTPLQWSNQYFQNLLQFNWTLKQSPANHKQFEPSDKGAPDGIMMLVSDLSLIKHDFFLPHVQEFARNLSALEHEFAIAWYHLTSHDMGPHSRCIGPFVPPPQSWQHPLPPPPSPDQLPNLDDVKTRILAVMRPASPHSALAPDSDGKSLYYYGAAFVKLAWQCAATFRRTDYQGGCNGARVRFAPQALWDVNRGMDAVIKVLQPVKDAFPKMSWADLIVFASHVAIEDSAAAASSPAPRPFCPGRTDASADDAPVTSLQPIIGDSASDVQYREAADLLGLTLREMVALHGRVRSSTLARLQGYNGSWSQDASLFGNQFYVTLMAETWEPLTIGGVLQYKAIGKDIYMAPADLNILWMPDLLAAAQDFAANASAHASTFHSAWSKVMNADRFDGPYSNLCDAPATAASDSNSDQLYTASQFFGSVIGISIGAAIFASVVTWLIAKRRANGADLKSYPHGRRAGAGDSSAQPLLRDA